MEFELKCGATLGRYQLLTQLGQGGMASVWVAREKSFGGAERLVAVKVMLPALATREDFRSMFLEEGQIVRSISHSNVVSVFDVAEDYGILYMAMEWVEGDSLRALIREAKKRRAIPAEMAVRMIADTAGGLHAAHELRDWDGRLCGLVHCDVSPHNILIGLNGQAKLVDFGVASATARTDKDQDLLKGKLGYMSPEQVRGTGLDRRSDVFSLGVVLYELTTGERLFRGESARDTLRLVSEAAIPKPTAVYAKYPEALEAIVLKALARDVNERFQTAEELRIALDRYLINERILVPEAGVGRLLKRVLGTRIEQQREAIREALRAVDGHVETGLVPSESTALLDGPLDVSLSGKSSPFSDGSFTSTPAASSSFPTSTNSLSDPTGTGSPQTLDPIQEPPRKKPWLALVGMGLVAAAGLVATLVWLKAQDPVGASLQTSKGPRSDSDGEAQDEDLNGSTAKAVPPPGDQAAPGEPVQAREAPLKFEATRQGRSAHKSSKTERELVERAGQEAADAVRAANDPAPTQTDVAPPLKRPEVNRGAATAALAAGAQRASHCTKPGGPTGAGQAIVTFHPEGYITNVRLNGAFPGTAVGNCVTAAFKQGSIPAFAGLPLTLQQAFRVPE